MNILVISDVSMETVCGGAERVLYEQCVYLRQQGHAVDLVTRKYAPAAQEMVTVDGVREFRYDAGTERGERSFFGIVANSTRLVRRLTRERRYDRIVVHQPLTAIGLLFSPAAFRIPAVYVCHSLSFEEYATRNRRPTKAGPAMKFAFNVRIRREIERIILKRCGKIVVLSEYMKHRVTKYQGVDAESVAVVPGGVDVGKFHPLDHRERQSARAALGIAPDDFVLFTVRNHVPRMGLENLILAMRAIVETEKTVRLVIGGTGPLTPKLKRLAEKSNLKAHIRFPGFIEEDRLVGYYQCADLFILPTVTLEGFGMVTLEALSSGLPVLGTPVGGTVEILRSIDDRFLFDGVDSGCISSKILSVHREIQNDPSGWARQRSLIREKVCERFDWDVVLRHFEEVLTLCR